MYSCFDARHTCTGADTRTAGATLSNCGAACGPRAVSARAEGPGENVDDFFSTHQNEPKFYELRL